VTGPADAMAFERQPTLRGSLIELRPLTAADHDALWLVASDPLIWSQHPAKSRGTPDGFRQFFEESLASGGALIATDTATGQVIGSSRFHGHDAAKDEVEIGWTFLARAYWGGRYNGELKRLMLEHAFTQVRNVVFLVDPGNVRSRRAVEKIGGVLIGTRTNAYGRESLVLGITASQHAGPALPRPATP